MNCSSCNEHYHILCVNISVEDFQKTTVSYLNTWACPSCKCSIPKGNNTHTPVRYTEKSDDVTNQYVNTRDRKKAKPPSPVKKLKQSETQLSNLTTEIRLLRQDMTDMKLQLASCAEALARQNTLLGNYEKKVAAQDDEISVLKSENFNLQQQLGIQAQHALKNELEIAGIPEKQNENLYHIVNITAQKLGVDLTDADLDWANRAGPRDSRLSDKQYPRPIVVRFTRRTKRDDIIKAARVRRNITTEGIVDGPVCKFYLNERLTKENRIFFRAARLRARLHSFKFCWIRNGGVFVRKEDRKPAIPLKSFEDLDKLVGPSD